MDEFGMNGLGEIADHIIDTSRVAMLEEIRRPAAWNLAPVHDRRWLRQGGHPEGQRDDWR